MNIEVKYVTRDVAYASVAKLVDDLSNSYL